jgi:hypothetical protein
MTRSKNAVRSPHVLFPGDFVEVTPGGLVGEVLNKTRLRVLLHEWIDGQPTGVTVFVRASRCRLHPEGRIAERAERERENE